MVTLVKGAGCIEAADLLLQIADFRPGEVLVGGIGELTDVFRDVGVLQP